LIESYHKDLDEAILKRDAEINSAVEHAQSAVKPSTANNGDSTKMTEEAINEETTVGEEIVQIKEAITKKAQPEIDALKKAAASAWITEMRFARRAEVRFCCRQSVYNSCWPVYRVSNKRELSLQKLENRHISLGKLLRRAVSLFYTKRICSFKNL